MGTGKKKKKKSPLAGFIFLFVIAAIVGLVVFVMDTQKPSATYVDGRKYFDITKEGEVALVVNGVLADRKGCRMDGRYYLPLEMVADAINPSFYWSEAEDTVIVTSPLDIKLYEIGTDATKDAVALGGEVYVSLDAVVEWSECETRSFTEPDRVMIDTVFTGRGVYALEDTVLRIRPDVRSDILKDVTGGETLFLGEAPEEAKEGWTYVSTEDGYGGFISTNQVSSSFEVTWAHESRIGEYTHLLSEDKIGLVFHQTTSQAANDALKEMFVSVTGVNVVAPTWFYLESDKGKMSSLASASYVETAHGLGLQVWAVANDFDGAVNGTTSTQTALSTRTRRQKIIDTLLKEVTKVGADGINLDFENISEECAPAYLEFIRELSTECRARSLVLSVDVYVPTYTRYLNRSEQARVADYVICMCYDEHHAGDAEAGSVASLPFVTKGIEDTLTEVPADQLIEAVPFFTRIWEGSGANLSSKAVSMWEMETYLKDNNMNKNWDNEAGQYYSELLTGNSVIKVWLEEAESLTLKLALVKERELAGAAAWKLGLETSDVWPILADALAF